MTPSHTESTKAEFSALFERHRRELQVHCYRMLGSLDESEDLLQETFLRAWRSRASFEGRSSFRAWAYRIATNACLDALQRRPRQPDSDEVPWLQPYPDSLLEGVAPDEEEPDAVIVARETIELAFMVAIQHLPPRTRAVLILRDVLGWPAKDVARLLDTTTAAVNSALQRARSALKERLPERRVDWSAEPEQIDEHRDLLRRYVEASENADMEALSETLSEDLRFSMPPEPGMWDGRDLIVSLWTEGGFGTEAFGEIRCLETRANRQPAVANYVRKPGEDAFRPLAIDVLRIESGAVAEIVAFGPPVFPAFGLPSSL
jgi:RNA polymerase sigma-70 factor (ECF subfamily)